MRSALTIAVACVAAAFATTSFAQSQPRPPAERGSREIISLAQNLDNAIKVCEELVMRAASHQADVGHREALAVNSGLLQFTNDPPPPLLTMAQDRGPARFGQWFDPHASIWVIAFETLPYCRIIVFDSDWAQQVLPELERLVRVGDFWRPRQPTVPPPVGLDRREFAPAISNEAGAQPVLTISAATGPRNGGQVQLTIGFALVSRVSQ